MCAVLKMQIILAMLLCAQSALAQEAAKPSSAPANKEEEFFAAVRRGDLPAVKALLDAGVDVNAKFRYGTTALFPACDRGHTEIVKLLLERGAEVNVRDTFYGATPLTWASSKDRIDIVQLLLDKGAQGLDQMLISAANRGSEAIARLALAKGGLKPETLSSALAAATRGKHTEVAKLLEEAGAKPPPKADFQVDAETLARYAGTYRSEAGMEVVFFVRDGKFFGGPAGQNPLPMNAINNTTFRPGEFDAITLVFRLEGDKVSSLVRNQGGNEQVFKRVEEKKE